MMRKNSRMVVFRPSDPVYVRNWSSGPKWLSGKVIEQHRATNVDVTLDDGRIIHRHLDHVRKRNPSEMPEDFLPLLSPPSAAPTSTVRRSTRNKHPPERLQISWN